MKYLLLISLLLPLALVAQSDSALKKPCVRCWPSGHLSQAIPATGVTISQSYDVIVFGDSLERVAYKIKDSAWVVADTTRFVKAVQWYFDQQLKYTSKSK